MAFNPANAIAPLPSQAHPLPRAGMPEKKTKEYRISVYTPLAPGRENPQPMQNKTKNYHLESEAACKRLFTMFETSMM